MQTVSLLCLLISSGSYSPAVWVCSPAVLFGKLYSLQLILSPPLGVANYRASSLCLTWKYMHSDLPPQIPGCHRPFSSQRAKAPGDLCGYPQSSGLSCCLLSLSKVGEMASELKEIAFLICDFSDHLRATCYRLYLLGMRGEPRGWRDTCVSPISGHVCPRGCLIPNPTKPEAPKIPSGSSSCQAALSLLPHRAPGWLHW